MTDLDAHVRRVVRHHFSPDTGTPYWLRWAERAGWSPADEVQGFADLDRFGPFDKTHLRDAPHADWTPRALAGRSFHIFETGGTTGVPTQRIAWEDHRTDYERFSDHLDPASFPPGAAWLILGPTGPRRLRLTMEHLAWHRGGIAYFVDLDPRWVRSCIASGDADGARRYQEHVIEQAVRLLRHRPIQCLFTTPRLLESLADRIDLPSTGITGVLCGGTSMSPQTVRFLVEEVLEGRVGFTAVYGNTLMGLARAEPVGPETGWEVRYHAPIPRAVLRVVGEDGADVPYGERGRVVLTTLTEELFLPNLHERDEAIRRPPVPGFEGDGIADVRPLGGASSGTIEGVY